MDSNHVVNGRPVFVKIYNGKGPSIEDLGALNAVSGHRECISYTHAVNLRLTICTQD